MRSIFYPHDFVKTLEGNRKDQDRSAWIEHIAQHDVEPEEVEEIVYEDCHPSWVVRGRHRGVRELRWTLFGQTCAGRYMVVVIAPYPQRGVWRAVTARDMERQTRRRYQRWRKS